MDLGRWGVQREVLLLALVRITHVQGKEEPEILVLDVSNNTKPKGDACCFLPATPAILHWTGSITWGFSMTAQEGGALHLPHHPPHPRGQLPSEPSPPPKVSTDGHFQMKCRAQGSSPGGSSAVVRTHACIAGHGFNPWSGN